MNAAHFAERHGGIILIALGESVIAIAMGASASNPSFKGEWLAGVVLSLVLVASLWWSHFDREDRRAADKLVAAEPEQRSRMGLLGYWYAHLVLISVGIRQLLEGHPGMGLLAGGMALAAQPKLTEPAGTLYRRADRARPPPRAGSCASVSGTDPAGRPPR